MKFNWSI